MIVRLFVSLCSKLCAAILIALQIALHLLPARADAQSLLFFPSENFGSPNKAYAEASHNHQILEVLTARTDVFERIWDLDEEDPYRRAGRSVGLLDLKVIYKGEAANTTCTATLVAPDRILTNYHCVPGKDFSVVEAQFRLGFLDRQRSPGEVYRVDATPVEANPEADYALLAVEGVPRHRFPHVTLTPRRARDKESLFLLHHPAGQPQVLTRVRCQASEPAHDQADVLIHHCDTLGGSSGAALFAIADGAFAGLHFAGVPDPVRPFNKAKPSSLLFAASAEIKRIGADLGALLSSGLWAYRKADYPAARIDWTYGCDGGRGEACTNLGFLYRGGLGVSADPRIAKALYSRGCEAGDLRGCTNLGLLYATGAGVARDPARARDLYRRSCEAGEAQGCANLGDLLRGAEGGPRDDSQALALLTRACEAGAPNGCASLGYMVAIGQGVPADPARGRALLQKGCAAGNQWGCQRLADLASNRLPEASSNGAIHQQAAP